jgi:hypothetical protein
MKLLTTILALINFACVYAQISFNYENVKTSDVIYSISKLTETTIVAPEINTYISLQATNVSKNEALNILRTQLSTLQYVLMRDGNIYVVKQLYKTYYENPNPRIISQPIVMRVFQIRSVDASNIARIVKNVTVNTVSQRNQILFDNFIESKNNPSNVVLGEIPPTITWDDYSNCLIARGVQSQIDEIERLLIVLDSGRNIVWVTKTYKLNHADVIKLSSILTSSFEYIVNGQYKVSITSYQHNKTLVVTCPENYINDLDNLIVCLDAHNASIHRERRFRTWSGRDITLENLLIKIGQNIFLKN